MSESVAGFQSLIDPDAACFDNPESMTAAIAGFCQSTKQKVPDTDAAYIRCIFDSLALKYRYVFQCLQKLAPFPIERLHVIGGGSQNKLLNQATANSIGVPVIAGPCEATAIGNIMTQAKGLGMVHTLSEMREFIANSVNLEIYTPEDNLLWSEAYGEFLKYIKS
jgi:rhamnulokinase